MLYNATNIEKIFDKKKTSGGLLSKKSKIYCVKLPELVLNFCQESKKNAIFCLFHIFIVISYSDFTMLIFFKTFVKSNQ